MTMQQPATILIGGADGKHIVQLASTANRHGLITGATGTGKTVTLQILAEGFSDLGVPVFTADIKGDLSGIAHPGSPHPKIDERVQRIGIADYKFQEYPVAFWDLFGKSGTPVRLTISARTPDFPPPVTRKTTWSLALMTWPVMVIRFCPLIG